SPNEVGYYDTPDQALGVAVAGSYAYVADGRAGLQIYENLLFGIEESSSKSFDFLLQSYPNPFSAKTVIRYSLPVTCGDYTKYDIQLAIYDISGRLVKSLVEGEKRTGYYTAEWDGRDDRGKKVTSGIYFYRLEAGDYKAARKLIILR
ncbi:T9SS type A sorting domain-containing protein, partial [candidate division WOR-3 bacterium]|nr:T9SS type A sorting domain-containing protein [candidate division WOR-3 bacterium]